MKNNKKKTRMTKIEKRRLAFEKRNVKKEQNLARYGAEGGSALVMAKTTEFNRRMLAALLALVFVLTSVIVGYNIATKAQGHDEGGYGMMETVDDETGMVLRKGYKQTAGAGTEDPNDDVYSLRLEAYSTKDTTTKAIKENTPLDIVMLLDQSGTMTTPDVFTGNYNEIENITEYSIDDAEGKYYKDPEDGKYYEITVRRAPAYTDAGKGPWTIATAKTKYIQNNGNYYPVRAGTGDLWRLDTENRDGNNGYKIYDNFSEDPPTAVFGTKYEYGRTSDHQQYYYDENNRMMHLVYYNTQAKGAASLWDMSFYTTLFYLTNSTSGNPPKSESAWTTAVNQGTVTRLGYNEDWKYTWTHNDWYNTSWYTGNLYQKIQGENHLYYNDGTNHSFGDNAIFANDTVYSDTLYNQVEGYQLCYTKNGVDYLPIGKAVPNQTDTVDTGTLYERDMISRLDAMKVAASDFAQQIAEASTEDVDNRIAVVGYNGDATAWTNLLSATADDSDDENVLNDNIDYAITQLNASGGSNLSAGLTKVATDVFANNILDPADSRKRIVIVFGDKETWESNDNVNTRTKDAVLKDTYNASIYTIGLFANGSTNVEQFMKELSSEYFFTTATAATPASYKAMGGTYHYLSNSDALPNDSNSIYNTFKTVATEVQAPITQFVLDSTNAVLKDIIHDNFNLPSDPESKTTIEVAEANSYTDGNPNWGDKHDDNNTSFTWRGKTLAVTGFNYDANYVSPERPSGNGKKIIVTIDDLTVNQRVRTESKSAKRIYFNTAASGIYKTDVDEVIESEDLKGKEELLINSFPRPFLDDETWLAPAGGTGRMSDDGVVVNKYLTPTEDGTYDLTVEAYTTRTSTTTIEKVPTDFIVVADQSGSMDERDMPTGYKTVSGTKTLEEIANGKYYVLGDDGNYYRVYGTRNYMWRYYAANELYVGDLIERFGTRLRWGQAETEAGQSITNQMFFREVVNGQTYYQPITMTVQGVPLTYYIRLSYDSASTGSEYNLNRENATYSSNGNSPWYRNVFGGGTIKSGAIWAAANAAVQLLYRDDEAYTYSELNLGIFGKPTTGMFINYPMYDRHVGYNQLLYRDANGTEHVLSSTTGQKNYEFCDDSGKALTSQKGTQPTYAGLYEATGYQTRLDALKNALTEFAKAVATESHLNNEAVDNRIAIVGFSSPGNNGSYATYNNTEILTGENLTISNKNGKRIDLAGDNDYATALVSATNNNTVGDVNDKIKAAINALDANGGTQPEDGLRMAFNILEKRNKKTYELQTGDNRGSEIDRNTIVIYFTDGRPGDYPMSNQYKEANDVVAEAKNIKELKNSTLETTNTYPSVFSIGVFGESDGNPMTYPAHQVDSKDVEYEYELGWMETVDGNGYPASVTGNRRWQYLNRNWIPGSPNDYGATASDTIYDYMSVVSSNYPNSTKYMQVKDNNPAGEADMTGYNNYLAMLEGVRGTYIGNNDYYRMASNQDTLVAAFTQAVTMMNQTISSDQRLDAASVMQDVFNNTDFVVEDGYSISTTTVDGKMDKYGTVNFDESTEAPASGVFTSLKTVDGKQTMTVTGFDYLENYITYGYIDSSNNTEVPYHKGKKLVVTISNVVPTITGNKFYSNISDNNKSSMFVNGRTVNQTDFPRPSISRHSYTLDISDVNRNATFTVAMKILDGSKNEVSKDANALADVILVYPNGTRKLYSEVGPQEFLQVGNGQSFYLENLPSNFKVKTDVTSTDDAYTYYLTYDNEAEEHKMTKEVPISKDDFSYDDHTIHIRSERGKKDVSVRERTIGSYGDTTHRFGEVITMEIPVLQGENLRTEFDCTFNDDFSGFENGLPSNATNYKAVFTVENPDATDKKVAKLTAISYIDSNGAPGTWSLANGETPPDYELPMRDGDVITFKDVPTGNTVKAIQPEKNKYEHEVFYYYGQDDVSPSGIKLMSSNGDLLSGTHTLTLKEVDGLENDRLTVTFVDGSITEIDGNVVDAKTTIDFAKYETIFVLAEDENDNLSDAKLNIDGTDVYFDTETENDQTAYVATIKRQTNRPPVSVTVEKNNMDILIINERGDIEIEGIFDNHHSKVIYILAGFGVLALAAGGYYVWKKKDEFVEQ